jgi:Flp pilus assembly protein TadG
MLLIRFLFRNGLLMITKNTISSSRHEKGQGTLELALVLPIFLTLLLGVFEIAFIFFYNVSVANASREAARYAASSGCPASTVCADADVQYYQDCAGIKNRAISKAPGIGLVEANIAISYDHGPNNSGVISPIADICSTTTPNLATGDRVKVTVTKQFTLIVPIPGLKNFPIVSTTYRTYLGKVQ